MSRPRPPTSCTPSPCEPRRLRAAALRPVVGARRGGGLVDSPRLTLKADVLRTPLSCSCLGSQAASTRRGRRHGESTFRARLPGHDWRRPRARPSSKCTEALQLQPQKHQKHRSSLQTCSLAKLRLESFCNPKAKPASSDLHGRNVGERTGHSS